MKKTITLFIAAALVIFVAVQVYTTFKESTAREPIRTMQATDFTLPSLTAEEYSLHEQRGKVVILNFWATWCEPCRIEMPHLQTFYEQHSKDVEILAVNVTAKDEVENVAKFAAQYGLTFPILLDKPGDVTTMFGAFALPMTVILNREGEIVQEILGPVDTTLLQQYVEPLL